MENINRNPSPIFSLGSRNDTGPPSIKVMVGSSVFHKKDQVDVNRWEDKDSAYLATFFNIFSYFLIFPFRIVKRVDENDPSSTELIYVTSKLRKVKIQYEMLLN